MNGESVFLDRDLPLWEDAKPYLDVRNNDEHTIVAYGLARQLVAMTPGADASVVLPAILLHDVGWKRVPEELLLSAVGRKPTRPDLVRDHEIFGMEIAREILERHKLAGVDIDAVCEIIDGHDTVDEAKDINDAVVKDADKGWRCTTHGMRTITNWYDIPVSQLLLMLEEKSNPKMHTPAGRALAECQTAAAKAEAHIKGYLGHGPEFMSFPTNEENEW